MLKNIISQGDFTFWPQLSIVLFFLSFLGLLIWANRRGTRQHYKEMSQMVIKDQSKEGVDSWKKKSP